MTWRRSSAGARAHAGCTGRQISSLPGIPFNSEREAALWLELNNNKELSVVGAVLLEGAILMGSLTQGHRRHDFARL
jgi:hypothetical protein